MLEVEFSIISGISAGFEYVSPAHTDDDTHHIVIDLLFVRCLIGWPA